LRLPPEVKPTVVRKQPLPKIADAPAAVVQALGRPIGSPSRSDLARDEPSAGIFIFDITRPAPSPLLLQPVIETLTSAGVMLENFAALVATGLHRPNLGDELAKLVGDDRLMRRMNVEKRCARRKADLLGSMQSHRQSRARRAA
jgi:nickel-dependent lactate racemase